MKNDAMIDCNSEVLEGCILVTWLSSLAAVYHSSYVYVVLKCQSLLSAKTTIFQTMDVPFLLMQ